MQRTMRMKRELQMLTESPPHGISCLPIDDKMDKLEAQILGGADTPYTGGLFRLEIQIPDRYPFEPPRVRFLTPIYHPNIDNAGRICLDTLKMPPKGAWKPCLNIGTVLTSIQLLMAEPNPDDPLMTDISDEFRNNKVLFQQNARSWTQKHAKESVMKAVPVPDEENLSESSSTTTSNRNTTGKMLPDDTTRKQTTNKRSQPMSDLTNKQPKLSSNIS